MSSLSERSRPVEPRTGRWVQLGRFRVRTRRPSALGPCGFAAPARAEVFEFALVDDYAALSPVAAVARVADEVACSCGECRADGPCRHINCLQCFGWLPSPSALSPQPLRPAVQLALFASVADEMLPF